MVLLQISFVVPFLIVFFRNHNDNNAILACFVPSIPSPLCFTYCFCKYLVLSFSNGIKALLVIDFLVAVKKKHLSGM